MPRPPKQPQHTARCKKMAELRARCLTFLDIARQLGVTKQAVSDALTRMGKTASPLRCQACRKVLAEVRRAWWPGKNQSVFCLPCLAKKRDAGLATMLTSFRVSAGMSQKELARKTGIHAMTVSQYERGTSAPNWSLFVRLSRALGVCWTMDGITGEW